MSNIFAFPSGVVQDGYQPGQSPLHEGMSLRDYFAAHAPAAPAWWWDSYKTIWAEDLGKAAQHEAQWRYVYADVMVKQRDEP